jgi:hypothetical protein
MTDIVRILVDSEEIKDFTKVIENENEVCIAESELELGDKITLIYDEDEQNYNEVAYLSVDHPNVYKNLALEAEVEFVKRKNDSQKNFELIVRAVNARDKTYVVDNYYAFGIQDSYFYMAKVAFHSELNNSYAYKILLNLNKDKDGVHTHFLQLSKEQQEQLFLISENLAFESKYKLRCEIKDDYATFRIKNTSKIESMEIAYPWVTIFENVNIKQELNEVSIRNDMLQMLYFNTSVKRKV